MSLPVLILTFLVALETASGVVSRFDILNEGVLLQDTSLETVKLEATLQLNWLSSFGIFKPMHSNLKVAPVSMFTKGWEV